MAMISGPGGSVGKDGWVVDDQMMHGSMPCSDGTSESRGNVVLFVARRHQGRVGWELFESRCEIQFAQPYVE